MKQARGNKRRVLGDVLWIGLWLIVGLVACFLVYLTGQAGERAEVLVEGRVVMSVALSEDGVYPIGTTNTLVIEDGAAYLVRSECPDHRCERGRICRVGESLTCLPNRVTVRVCGESEVDFVP